MISAVKNQARNIKRGFALIEALTVLFIFCLIVLTFYSVFSAGTRYVIDAKNRLGALSVANGEIETVRNLKYDDIGTVGGEIGGNIPQDKEVMVNSKRYYVHTLVEYVDDPFDGLGNDDEIWFEDYKRVTMVVSWTASASRGEVKLISRFVPPGREVAHAGDGILTVNVFSDQPGGTGIANASVHIRNLETGLDTQKNTDSSGSATFMGSNVKDSIQKYEIIVSKSGYETVATMPPYPSTDYDPKYTHASVVTGSENQIDIAQNLLGRLKVASVDYLGQSINDISFHITGGKEIGKEHELPNDIVYNVDDEEHSTGSSGEKDFGDMSPGPYTATPSLSETNYELIGTSPPPQFFLLGGNEETLEIRLAKKDMASLLIRVDKSEEGVSSSVSGASVQVTSGLGYDSTQTTDSNGSVFFPTDADPFLPGTYDIKITAADFSENNSQATISPDQLQVETITLTPLTP